MSFVIDPEGLRAHARAIEGTAAGAAPDLARLRRGIDAGAVDPFGTDEGVGVVYRELTALTGEVLDLIGATTARSGGGLRRMAEDFAAADEVAAAGFPPGERGSAEPS